ncbi:MAG: hypothetical protein RLZ98_875 [Pseudomonadota bacterium]|jgi:cob(I)alamin adenosyltransferase
MVVLNKIYTRTGDDGTTALGNGARVAKTSARVVAFGTVDETNATIGLVRAELAANPGNDDTQQATLAKLATMLAEIQNDLFDLGADLCVPASGDEQPGTALRITAGQVARLEDQIDAMNSGLAPLRSFVLPGGTRAAAALHLARTICRRAERETVALAALPDEPVSDAAIKYLNRLSDFLFVASRYVNATAAGDVLWVPGQNR